MDQNQDQNLVDTEREAEDYVNSVMSSQPPAATLRTPLPSGRKRSISESAADTEAKKRRGDNLKEDRQAAGARRSILQDKDGETGGDIEVIEIESSQDTLSRRQKKAAKKGRAAVKERTDVEEDNSSDRSPG